MNEKSPRLVLIDGWAKFSTYYWALDENFVENWKVMNENDNDNSKYPENW